MKLSPHHFAGLSGLAAAFLVLIGTWAFASMRPDYSHISQTISELGEYRSPGSRLVSFGVFLPAGLLVWLAISLAYRSYASDRLTSTGLLAFTSVGLGYVMAAFFPCDPGSPLMGSWRQQIHNLFGLIEYLGGGIGLIAFGCPPTQTNASVISMALILSGVTVLVCLALLSTPIFFDIRGLVQRLAEIILFGWLTLASIALIFGLYQPDEALEGCRKERVTPW